MADADRRGLDPRLLAAVLLVGYMASGVYFVAADQQAVVVRFGRVTDSRVLSGVHWTWPSPVARRSSGVSGSGM